LKNFHLSGDSDEVADAVGGQVANFQLGVDVGKSDVVFLSVKKICLRNGK
jgi:hypothetical protein